MNKIMRIGTMKIGKMSRNIFVKAELKEGNLSISGVIGPMKSGNAYGGCGQIDMEFKHRNDIDDDRRTTNLVKPSDIRFAPAWNADKWYDLLDIWKEYHLNDMKAACEHQIAEKWDKKPDIVIKTYSIKWEIYCFLEKNKDNIFSARNAFNTLTWKLNKNVCKLSPFSFVQVPESQLETIKKALSKIKGLPADTIQEKTEIKGGNRVYETEHKDGILMKACPVCGYKYGSAWLKMEIPQEVIDKLKNFPDTDLAPNWI